MSGPAETPRAARGRPGPDRDPDTMLASQPAPGSACARLRATCAEPPRGKNIRPMRTRFIGGTSLARARPRACTSAGPACTTRRRSQLACGRSLVSVHEHHGHGHDHAISANADRGKLRLALGLILGFMLVGVVAGVLAGSLALLSDAAHMLTDAGAIGLALAAAAVAARPPSGRFTFGLGRAEILSAQANGATLLVLAGVIGFDAVRRLLDPPDVEGGVVLAVGLLGAVVNIAAAWSLARAERRSLNVEGARAHVLTDLYASL